MYDFKKYKYWFNFACNIGLISFICICVCKLISYAYIWRFRSCGGFTPVGFGRVCGWNAISIGTLSIGARYRIEALYNINGEKYNPTLNIGTGVSFGNDLHIGCVNSIFIGNGVLGGSGITIMDHDHGSYQQSSGHPSSPTIPPALRKLSHSTIVIEENVYIGEKVTILQGVRIGAGSIIGAGSVVTKSIPKNTIAVGVPAKSIKNFKHNKWVAIEQF